MPARVIHRQDALASGFSRQQIGRHLATGRWRRMLPSVYLISDTERWSDRIAAALLYAGPQAMLTGAAALQASEIRIARPRVVTVLVPPGCGPQSRDWVRLRRTARMPEPLNWMGPRRAPVGRAVADYALTARRLDDVRTVLARAVRSGWCSLPDIEAELAAAQRNGSALLRQAVAEVAGGAASAPEAAAAVVLRRGGITGFEQNARIRTPDGGWYFADFLWRARRAILEIDSVEHHLDPADWRATMDRHLTLETMGFSVIHRPPSALRDPVRFVDDVRAWLASRP